MRREEVTWIGVALTADTSDQVIILIEDCHAALQFRYVTNAVVVNDDVAGLSQAGDLSEIVAGKVEALYAPVLTVTDIDVWLSVTLNYARAMRQVELAGTNARFTPGPDVLAA